MKSILFVIILILASSSGFRRPLINKFPRQQYDHRLNLVQSPAQPLFVDQLSTKYFAMFLVQIQKLPLLNVLPHYWVMVPSIVRQILSAMYPWDLLVFLLFNLTYSTCTKLLYKLQCYAWNFLKNSKPFEYEKVYYG